MPSDVTLATGSFACAFRTSLWSPAVLPSAFRTSLWPPAVLPSAFRTSLWPPAVLPSAFRTSLWPPAVLPSAFRTSLWSPAVLPSAFRTSLWPLQVSAVPFLTSVCLPQVSAVPSLMSLWLPRLSGVPFLKSAWPPRVSGVPSPLVPKFHFGMPLGPKLCFGGGSVPPAVAGVAGTCDGGEAELRRQVRSEVELRNEGGDGTGGGTERRNAGAGNEGDGRVHREDVGDGVHGCASFSAAAQISFSLASTRGSHCSISPGNQRLEGSR